MPCHKVHAYLDRMYFGKVYWRVHRAMDWPAYYVKRNHRIYFHDVPSVYLIAKQYYPADLNAIDSGLMHLKIDYDCTRDPAYRAQLEFFAEHDMKERKKQKRRVSKQSTPKVFKEQEEFLRKIQEIRRLYYTMTSC